MGESSSRVSPTLQHPTAGIIKRLRLENFMCHTKHETEFGSHVNFITGQNGSPCSVFLLLNSVFSLWEFCVMYKEKYLVFVWFGILQVVRVQS